MKIALVGSSGYISSFILSRFYNNDYVESILKIDKTGEIDAFLDLKDAEKFDYSILDEIDFVIFTAAISSPDQCSEKFESCWRINVTGTEYFIREALIRKCRVLFFSSDAVFGDVPGVIYNEESETHATTPYGRMKKAVEDAFKEEPLFKAVRLSYVVSAKDRFISYCLNCIREDKEAEIYHPFYRNMISVSDVVNIVSFFAFHWDEYNPRFLNAAGKELVSRLRIADEINRIVGGRLKYTVVMPKESFFANRPQITQVESLYMRKYKILIDNSFTEKIRLEIREDEI